MLLGWRQFRLHFSYSTSSAWASNDSEFLDKESTFTIYGVMPCIFATPPTNNDTGVQQMSRCWILRQNNGLLIGFDDKVGARRCILRRQRLSILGCIRSCLLQLLRGYYLKLFRTQGLISSPERIWESNGVCIKFQIAKHVKVGSGADGRMPPISPPVLA